MSGSYFFVKRENLNKYQENAARDFCNQHGLNYEKIEEFGFMTSGHDKIWVTEYSIKNLTNN